jgi:hypothetical protein
MEQRRKSKSRRARRSNSGRQGSGPRLEALRPEAVMTKHAQKPDCPVIKRFIRKRSALKPLMHEREGFVLFLLVWAPSPLSASLCTSPRRKSRRN